MNSSASVSVLIPVYNEVNTVGTVIKRVLGIDAPIREVVVVDDGSTDGTGALLAGIANCNARVRVLTQPENKGKTAAVQRAVDAAVGDILIIQDADLEYDAAEIPVVIAPILEGQADVVYGSRFMVRRAARVLYYYHYVANRALTVFSNLLTNRNMTDIETGYKALRAEVIKPLRFTSRGFGMEVEITALVCKTLARTYEVPISYYGRTYEEGKKIGVVDGLQAVWYIMYYNVIAPRRRAGKHYIRTVNASLAGSSAPPELHPAPS